MLPELAGRLLGSADLFEGSGRGPLASLNFVTSHDGFTLADLGQLRAAHNEANGEGNRDGHDDNLSLQPRRRGTERRSGGARARATCSAQPAGHLLLAQGTPMLLMGDELGHSQAGNNNAYCQDNAMTWLDWEQADAACWPSPAGSCALRRDHPALRQRRFLHGPAMATPGLPDVTWLAADGREKDLAHWQDPANHGLGLMLAAPDDGPAAALNARRRPWPSPAPGRGRLAPAARHRVPEAAPGAVGPSLTLPAFGLALLAAVAPGGADTKR